jgi:dienelactone hydrolase
VRRQAECERSILSAIRAYAAQRPLAGERVWIAGEGHGATVAFDVALRSPGLFLGVILWNGAIHPDTPVDRARAAAALGLRVVFASDAPAFAESGERWLRQCGFESAEIVRLDGDGAPAIDAHLREIVAR